MQIGGLQSEGFSNVKTGQGKEVISHIGGKKSTEKEVSNPPAVKCKAGLPRYKSKGKKRENRKKM